MRYGLSRGFELLADGEDGPQASRDDIVVLEGVFGRRDNRVYAVYDAGLEEEAQTVGLHLEVVREAPEELGQTILHSPR